MAKVARPFAFLFLLALFALPAATVFAVDSSGTQPPPDSSGGGLLNPLSGVSSLNDLLGKVLDGVIAIGTVVITIMLVYCGFLFVVAQGSEEKIRDARSALLWTVIGALVLLGAKVIQEVIVSTVATLK